MKRLYRYRKHILLLLLGVLLGGAIWYALGIQPAAVPLASLRFDDDNDGLGQFPLRSFPQYPSVQVDRAEKIHLITERGTKHQLHMVVLAPDGMVTATTPLLRQDGRPLSGGVYGAFVVNPHGTRWWVLRHAREDWDGKTDSVVLTVHGTDGRALQEWKMPTEELFADLGCLYAAGDNQVAVALASVQQTMYIVGKQEPRILNLTLGDTVMPDGAAWRCETDPWDAGDSATVHFTITYTPPGGKPKTWASFQGIGAMRPSVVIPSEAGLVVQASSPQHVAGIYRISQDGRYTCLYNSDDMPETSGREDEKFSFSYPIYANRDGDHWRTSTSRNSVCTVWKFTKLPRWKIWLRALNEKNTAR